MEIRLLMDEPRRGSLNMALDEALMESVLRTSVPCWRFYFWERPTVSLGYFQTHRDRGLHAASAGCDWVRRVTGGGAIVHDRELTYSMVVPLGQGPFFDHRRLVDDVHGALIEQLGEYGVAARRHEWLQPESVRASADAFGAERGSWAGCGAGDERLTGTGEEAGSGSGLDSDAGAVAGSGGESFLCFQRRSAADVVCGESKICGSAQRKQRQVLLQHGSLLLHHSSVAPELLGVGDVAEVDLNVPSLAQGWIERLATRWQIQWRPSSYESVEIATAQRLEFEKYASSSWNEKR
jgi:lipoate-protein ligase A